MCCLDQHSNAMVTAQCFSVSSKPYSSPVPIQYQLVPPPPSAPWRQWPHRRIVQSSSGYCVILVASYIHQDPDGSRISHWSPISLNAQEILRQIPNLDMFLPQTSATSAMPQLLLDLCFSLKRRPVPAITGQGIASVARKWNTQ